LLFCYNSNAWGEEGELTMQPNDTLYTQNEEEISLFELFDIFWKRKIFITLMAIVGLLFGFSVAYIGNQNNITISTIVEFQWDGINEGSYPNDARFDYNNLFTVNVMNTAITQQNLNVTSNELRQALSVNPIVPSDVLALIQQELERGNQITYYPTEFKYSVNVSMLGISDDQGQQLLSDLFDLFRSDFESKYIKREVVLNYAVGNLSSYDYTDITRLIGNQLELIDSAVNQVIDDASSFVSATRGLSFNDILVQSSLVRSIELQNINSIVSNFLLTRNLSLAITKLQYEIEQDTLELNTEKQVLEGLEHTISGYTGSTSTIYIPGQEQTFTVDTYINTLYEELTQTQRMIAELEQSISYNEILVSRYLGLDETFTVSPEAQQEQLLSLEVKIDNLIDATEALVEDTNTLLEEYNQIVVKSISSLLANPSVEPHDSVLLYSAIGLVLGGMVSVVIVFIQHFNKTRKQTFITNNHN
jgi:capsular polysaccharide biosynthesis protein